MFWRLCSMALAKLPRRSLAFNFVYRLVCRRNARLFGAWDAGWTRHSPWRLFGVLRGLYHLSRLKWDNNPYRRMGPHVLRAYNQHAAAYGFAPLAKEKN